MPNVAQSVQLSGRQLLDPAPGEEFRVSEPRPDLGSMFVYSNKSLYKYRCMYTKTIIQYRNLDNVYLRFHM